MDEIRGKNKLWGRWVWVPMNPSPPPNQNFAAGALAKNLSRFEHNPGCCTALWTSFLIVLHRLGVWPGYEYAQLSGWMGRDEAFPPLSGVHGYWWGWIILLHNIRDAIYLRSTTGLKFASSVLFTRNLLILLKREACCHLSETSEVWSRLKSGGHIE